MPDKVTLVSPQGQVTDVDASQADAWLARGFRPQANTERAEAVATEQRRSEVSPVDTAIFGGLRGATLGGSDVALRAIGGQGVARKLTDIEEAHPIVGTVTNLAGALAIGGAVGKLGSAVSGLAGGGIVGGLAGGVAEGSVYGLGNAASQLAMSEDPLTAEHIASAISSNVLLGGGIGGIAGAGAKLFERGLQIAGDKLASAGAARAAVDGLPEELQGLDDAGLKQAHATAKAEHALDIKAEKASLDEIRANQRAEMANRVQELHENLATDRPIFHALSDNEELNPALKDIDGVSDARVRLAKSYKSMRAALDSPLSIERDPTSLIRPLEQRQVALEALQGKLPEMHAALAGDARANVLEHVDAALAETKDQIAAIRYLKESPVSSGRLTQLLAGDSPKMEAIAAAREALKQAPELGLVGKAAKGAAFGGATALAHMIPGVGIAAPFVGKAVSDAVERLFQRGAAVVGKVGEKASGAAQKFLAATKTLEPYVAPAATKVLSAVRFGASKADATEGDLVAHFRARTAELYSQTMRLPDGTTVMRPEARAAMAAKFDPIRQVNPILADKIETTKARGIAYLASIAPKKPEAPGLQIGPDNSRPSDMKIREWARAVRAVEHPESVEERLARGLCTPEEANCYRTVYPERFAALQREIFMAAPTLDKTLPMSKKVALSIFTGIPVTPAMEPNVIAVLQSTFDVEPGTAGGTQAPGPRPNFGALGSLKDIDKPTPAQQRAQGER